MTGVHFKLFNNCDYIQHYLYYILNFFYFLQRPAGKKGDHLQYESAPWDSSLLWFYQRLRFPAVLRCAGASGYGYSSTG